MHTAPEHWCSSASAYAGIWYTEEGGLKALSGRKHGNSTVSEDILHTCLLHKRIIYNYQGMPPPARHLGPGGFSIKRKDFFFCCLFLPSIISGRFFRKFYCWRAQRLLRRIVNRPVLFFPKESLSCFKPAHYNSGPTAYTRTPSIVQASYST